MSWKASLALGIIVGLLVVAWIAILSDSMRFAFQL